MFSTTNNQGFPLALQPLSFTPTAMGIAARQPAPGISGTAPAAAYPPAIAALLTPQATTIAPAANATAAPTTATPSITRARPCDHAGLITTSTPLNGDNWASWCFEMTCIL